MENQFDFKITFKYVLNENSLFTKKGWKLSLKGTCEMRRIRRETAILCCERFSHMGEKKLKQSLILNLKNDKKKT